jgi:acetolactate synthase-1/2/3 large subunit
LGRTTSIDFGNPDLVKMAQSFGAKGYRVQKTEDLPDVLSQALGDGTVSVIDCPVDTLENMRLTTRLKELVSPLESDGMEPA